MLWLIFQFFRFNLKFFLIKKIQLMTKKYFLDFFFQRILREVWQKTLIE